MVCRYVSHLTGRGKSVGGLVSGLTPYPTPFRLDIALSNENSVEFEDDVVVVRGAEDRSSQMLKS